MHFRSTVVQFAATLLSAIVVLTTPMARAQDTTASSGARPSLEIDAGFPGGNIVVDEIVGDTVRLRPDLRDTQGNWFYWYFAVAGAAGRTVTFDFGGRVMAARGPAVSLDEGRTWRWLDRCNQQFSAFTYQFPPNAGTVRFSMGMPYLESNLNAFLDRHRGNRHLRREVLCRTSKDREVERLHVGRLDGDGRHRVLLTGRHHACEMMASYVLEGILEAVLDDTPEGKWLRENVEFVAVPFMDKDGVEDGDQGKNRKPHDHNRDYGADSVYPSVKALKDYVPRWSGDRLAVALDLHCPLLAGGWSEILFLIGSDTPAIWAQECVFSKLLEASQAGPLVYAAADNMARGKGWNKTGGFPQEKACTGWMGSQPGIKFATSLEVPYATVKGQAVTADSAGLFGRSLARALHHYLKGDFPPKSAAGRYEHRVESVRRVPGLAAFWDFVRRVDGADGAGNFLAHTAPGDARRYVLEPHNISRDFWREGSEVTMADFPLLGRGPFGQAVGFGPPRSPSDLPVLVVPRSVLHDSPLDVKGPEKSVSMVVWLIHQEGSHAIAGLWHEGTITPAKEPALVMERGRRQYGLFAGLGGNPRAPAAHVSENGLSSFGDRYARHLAVTPQKMTRVPPGAAHEQLDAGWSVVGLVFANDKDTVTAYLNGVADEHWIESPTTHGHYAPNARAWLQAKLARIPGTQPGENPDFPKDQFYEPPEGVPLREEVVADTATARTVIRTYAFTKVRTTWLKDAAGRLGEPSGPELVALKANPYWFGHDLYAPPSATEGGPFTVGRVIHSNRHATLTAWVGGVAVFARAITPPEMRDLAAIGRAASSLDAPLEAIPPPARLVPGDSAARRPSSVR